MKTERDTRVSPLSDYSVKVDARGAHLSKSRWCNVARSIRESFSSAFPPLFQAAFHYATLETESTRAEGGRRRAFVPLCTRLRATSSCERKVCRRQCVSSALRRLGFTKSSQFISLLLLLLLSLSRGSAGFLSFLCLFFSLPLRPHFASLARAESDGIAKESSRPSRPTAAGLLQRQRGCYHGNAVRW